MVTSVKDLMEWDIYEVNSKQHALTGNRVRGRLRKFAVQHNINLLVENTQDGEPRIRFAVISETDITLIQDFLRRLFDDIQIEVVLRNVKNPVLSRIRVNMDNRYTI